jgi:hypothetical protein
MGHNNFTEKQKSTTFIAVILKLNLPHYTPWRRLGGQEVQLLLILDLGTGWG